MEAIPVSFEHEGEIFKGKLTSIMGAGDTSMWYLMGDDNFYNGRLRIYNGNWVFDATPKTESFKQLADFFGEVITAWIE